MKKLLLLIATVLTLSTTAQTSIYHPFPDSNATWNIYYSSGCMSGTDVENYSITISGDTLINTQIYHKLTSPYIQYSLAGSCTITHNAGYKGAIRQETLNKKVFYIPPTVTTEQLLYDFNLQVGDSVKGFLENWAWQKDTVESVDSILIGSNYRKRWKINSCYNIYLIEGIGSTYGLIEFSPGCVTDQAYTNIACYQQDGITLYPDTTTNCQLITSINSVDPISNQVKVFPNPSNDLFTVDFDQPFNIKEIRVTDLLGNIVIRQQTNNQKKINIDNLPSGSYILTVINKDGTTKNIKIISSL
jgi:hypothetical protein